MWQLLTICLLTSHILMTKVISYCVLHNRACKRILNVREWFLADRGFHITLLNSDHLSRNLSALASVTYNAFLMLMSS